MIRAGVDASPLIFLEKLDALDALTHYQEVLTTVKVLAQVLPGTGVDDPEAL